MFGWKISEKVLSHDEIAVGILLLVKYSSIQRNRNVLLLNNKNKIVSNPGYQFKVKINIWG
jgi:hypothetical protein